MNLFVDEIVGRIVKASGLGDEQVRSSLSVPPREDMGDYALVCFALAKQLRANPAKIASDLAAKVEPGDGIERVEAVGPYLNFILERGPFISHTLRKVLEHGEAYGSSGQGRGKTLVIDFSSPNLAKQFSIAHLRSTAIGHSIYKLHAFLGWNCVGINHLGDWGGNFGQLLAAYRRWADPEEVKANPLAQFLALYTRFNEELEKKPGLQEEARQCVRELEAGNAEVQATWRFFVEESLREAERIYEILGVRFDATLGESFFAERIDDVIGQFEAAGLARESEGALIVDLQEWDMPPCILRTSRGTSTYHSRDLAALFYRQERYSFDKMVYVTDVRQNLHFRQLFKAVELLGKDWIDRCEHAPFGMMSFKGEKMSTRKGNMVFLEDVLNEAVELVGRTIEEKNPGLSERAGVAQQVGVGALVFADLDSRRTRDVVFDWNDVLNFDGETGPYLQYTHARFCSILRKFGRDPDPAADLGVLGEEAEMRVARKLAQFPGCLELACGGNEPSLLSTYLLELAAIANKFYNELPVLSGEDSALVEARVLLVGCVSQVLRTGLSLLGMQAPVEM